MHCLLAVGHTATLPHRPEVIKRYPDYFANILGVGKAIGLAVFLAPGIPRFKEWAYAGFSITILSACYSHFSSGDRLLALEPLLTFVALVGSYFTRPDDRKIPGSIVVL